VSRGGDEPVRRWQGADWWQGADAPASGLTHRAGQ
jgi:hypothetical protein